MDDRFYGLNSEDKAKAQLIYQKALIWLTCLEQQINERSIDGEDIMKSYLEGIREGLIEENTVLLDEYIDHCYMLLTLYVQVARALFSGEEKGITQHGGYSNAKEKMDKIGDAYHFLIESTRKSVTDLKDQTPKNVSHILSAKQQIKR